MEQIVFGFNLLEKFRYVANVGMKKGYRKKDNYKTFGKLFENCEISKHPPSRR